MVIRNTECRTRDNTNLHHLFFNGKDIAHLPYDYLPILCTRPNSLPVRRESHMPHPITVLRECAYARAIRRPPHAHRLVFRVGEDQVLLGKEQDARDVVEVAAEGVDLPGPALCADVRRAGSAGDAPFILQSLI